MQDQVTNQNQYISTTTVHMATKLGSMVTYLDEILPQSKKVLASRCAAKSREKLKTYLQYHNA